MKGLASRLLPLVLAITVVLSTTSLAFAAQTANPSGVRVMPTLVSYYSSHAQTGAGLSDGTQVNEWDTQRVVYWYTTGDYVELTIPKDVKIWRSGTASWLNDFKELTIKRKDASGVYTDVTVDYSLPASAITNSQWEQFTKVLPAGTYKFEFKSAYRIDSEWYMEEAVAPVVPAPVVPDPVILLTSGLNNIGGGVNIVNYTSANSIKQSLILPLGYSTIR
jgi:hypothetical protein